LLRYAADENFNHDILRGLRRRDDRLDVVHVQAVDLSATVDPIILEWARRIRL
jgi:hypothetical protein